jgi:hypothetical protein
MAVTEAQPGGPGVRRFKASAQAGVAAVAIVAAVVGGSLVTARNANDPVRLPTRASIKAPTAAVPPGAPEPGSALPGVQFDQPPPGAPPGLQMGMEIVVKLKDDSKIKDIIDAFWKDQPSAKAKFEAFKASHPVFAGLKLDRVTYSNELVLVNDGTTPPAGRLAAMREIARKLNSAPDISYAEPNMTAQAGGQ